MANYVDWIVIVKAEHNKHVDSYCHHWWFLHFNTRPPLVYLKKLPKCKLDLRNEPDSHLIGFYYFLFYFLLKTECNQAYWLLSTSSVKSKTTLHFKLQVYSVSCRVYCSSYLLLRTSLSHSHSRLLSWKSRAIVAKVCFTHLAWCR